MIMLIRVEKRPESLQKMMSISLQKNGMVKKLVHAFIFLFDCSKAFFKDSSSAFCATSRGFFPYFITSISNLLSSASSSNFFKKASTNSGRATMTMLCANLYFLRLILQLLELGWSWSFYAYENFIEISMK